MFSHLSLQGKWMAKVHSSVTLAAWTIKKEIYFPILPRV